MSNIVEEEVVINYAASIEVVQTSDEPVEVSLTQQGPQGPQGKRGATGDTTPQLIALQEDVAAKAAAAETVLSDAIKEKNAVVELKDQVSQLKGDVETAEQNVSTARQDVLSARNETVTAKDVAVAKAGVASTSVEAIQSIQSDINSTKTLIDAARDETVAARGEAVAAKDSAKTSSTDSLNYRNAADASATEAANDLVEVKTARNDVITRQANVVSFEAAFSDAKNDAEEAASQASAARDESQTILTQVSVDRTDTLAAKNTAETAASEADAASISIQSTKEEIESLKTDIDATATETQNYAAQAAESAAQAALFDPSSIAWQVLSSAASGVSIRTLTSKGVVNFDVPADVQIALDFPVDNVKGQLIVSVNSDETFIYHEFRDATGRTYVCHSSDAGVTWSEWSKVWVSSDLQIGTRVEAEAGSSDEARVWSASNLRAAIVAYASAKGHTHTIADVAGLQGALDAKASLVSPALTGAPTAPTPASNDNSGRVATTSFVQTIKGQILGDATSVADTLGELQALIEEDDTQISDILSSLGNKADKEHTHVINDVSGLQSSLDSKAPIASPTLTGVPRAPTAAPGASNTQIATTAFVASGLSGKASVSHSHAIADVTGLQAALDSKPSAVHTHDIDEVNGLQGALDAKAPIASPTLTGSPKAPTATAGTNTTQIATTAFVAEGLSGKANASHSHAISDVSELQLALNAKANLASPALTGTPTAPTQTEGNNSTRLATTAFTMTAVSRKANLSHSHAIGDVTNLQSSLNAKANLSSPALTGTPTAPTQAEGNNSTRIATTAFVTTGLSRKANSSHTHSIANITNLQSSLNEKASLSGATFTGSATFNSGLVLGNNETTNNDTTGGLIYDANFFNDADYGTGIRSPTGVFAGNGGGLAVKTEDGWAGVFDTRNMQWATLYPENIKIGGSNQVWHAGNFTPGNKLNTSGGVLNGHLSFNSSDGRGVRFWNSDSYKIYMSKETNGTWGGRLDGSSDYNIYLRISGGTNRGFVFQNGSNSVAQVDGSGNIWLTGNLISTKDIYMNNRAIIANDFGGATSSRGGSNIDHIWHDEGANAWNFCSDTSYKATGNSKLYCGSVVASGSVSAGSIAHNGTGTFNVTNSANTDMIFKTANTNRLWIKSGGRVGVNTSSPSSQFHVNGATTITGNLVASGNVTAYSDRRLKSNVKTISDALVMVRKMRGVTFEMAEKSGVGVIAQEMQEILPEVIEEADDEMKTLSVAYGNIVGVLIEAIKELSKEVEELKGGQK